MSIDQTSSEGAKILKAAPPIQSTTATDELSDTQLDRVSAGSIPISRTPSEPSLTIKSY